MHSRLSWLSSTSHPGPETCAGPGKETEAERIARLVKQLGDDDFAKREAGSKELDDIGEPADPALRKEKDGAPAAC
jgi:hypothetical protein